MDIAATRILDPAGTANILGRGQRHLLLDQRLDLQFILVRRTVCDDVPPQPRPAGDERRHPPEVDERARYDKRARRRQEA